MKIFRRSPKTVTPDQRHGQLATVRRRLASMLYDGILMVGVLIMAFLVPQMGYAMAVGHTAAPWAMGVHIFLLMGAYYVRCWHRGGQTLAMRTWHLKLDDAIGGGYLPLGRAWLRYILSWPSLLFFGVGLFWALFDRDRQFLHDRLAGTRVLFWSSDKI